MVKSNTFDQTEYARLIDLCTRVEALAIGVFSDQNESLKTVSNLEIAKYMDQYEKLIRGILDSYSNRYNM